MVFGFAVSGSLQVFVSNDQMGQLLGQTNLSSIDLAIIFGTASSLCSYAAAAVDMIHAAAAGAWPGGLLPLMLLLAQARRQTELLPAAVTITRRFSRLSVMAVAVLAMSGSLNAYALIGTFNGLWSSVYGRLVVCKVLLFATMVALGAMNKGVIEQNPMASPHATVNRLWRNVAAECIVVVAVLLVTEALAMNTPATHSK